MILRDWWDLDLIILNNLNLDLNMWNEGIEPTWEDPNNAKGGKWIVRLKKGLASRYWEEILLALLGEQFTGIPHDEICGAVVSCRYNEDILSVWNRNCALALAAHWERRKRGGVRVAAVGPECSQPV